MKTNSIVPLAKRLAKHSRRNANGCLEWTGALNDHGYGRIVINRKSVRAHRVSWEIHRGSIPEGLRVLHECDNPRCIAPEHLFLGTDGDNVRDMVSKGRGLVGEKHGNSRVSIADVKAIRNLPTTLTHKEVAGIFHLSFQQVSRIRRGEVWNHPSLSFPQQSNV